MADVAPNASSGAAGTELRTIEAIRRQGHEVDEVWAPQLGRHIENGNLHYLLELPRSYRRELKARLRRNAYDVVHVNQPHGYLAARYFRQGGGAGVFIHRSHGLELLVEETLSRWRWLQHDQRPLVRRVLSRVIVKGLARHSEEIVRWAHGHIVSSSLCAEFLRTRLQVPPERIAVIPQAAPAAFLEVPAPTLTPKRLRRILYVGQYAFFKAPMIVAQALGDLAADPDLQLTWVCARRDHEEVRRLLSPTVRERVKMLDWISTEELIQLYDQHGIFILGSFFEGFGKVFIEAMARGLAVVATDVGGAHDVIETGVNGILVEPGQAASLAEDVRRLLRDPARAAALGAAAASAARNYTWERVGRETVAFYQARLASL